jgi:hypothetical protein
MFAVNHEQRLSHCVILSWTVNIQDVGPEVCLLAIRPSDTVTCHISILRSESARTNCCPLYVQFLNVLFQNKNKNKIFQS